MDTEALEIEEISLEGYEVVRGEFISQAGMPVVTFDGFVVSFNAASLKIIPDTESILFMINRRDNTLCTHPCKNGEKCSFRWCSYGKKRQPRHGKCDEFVLRLMKFTGWTFDYKYKLLGSVVKSEGVTLLKFDIVSAQKFARKNVEDEKLRQGTARINPEGWDDGFGLSLAEHEKEVNMPVFQENTTIIIDADKEGDD